MQQQAHGTKNNNQFYQNGFSQADGFVDNALHLTGRNAAELVTFLPRV